jgi:predicted outer membrane repeat protein
MLKSEPTISRFVPLSIVFLIFFVFLLIASESFAGVVAGTKFVSASGSDANDPCTNPMAPCRQIEFAINGVQSANGDEIKVEAGGYEHFKIDGFSNLSVIGGFLPGSNFANGSRTPFNQTFVSGGVNNRAVTIVDSANIKFDSLVLHLGNSTQLWENGEDCVDNNGQGDPINAGGCLLVNRTGGFTGIDLDINSCKAVPGSGGGFAWCDCTECELVGSAQFDRCVVENNDASFTDTALTQNIGGGGGLILESDGQIDNCDIRNSEIVEFEGGGSGDGGGLFVVDSTLNIMNSEIQGNHAYDGAGVQIVRVFMEDFGDVFMVDTQVRDNQAEDNGGALNAKNSSIQIVRNTFFHNIAGTDGGGDGGGCYCTASICTFYGNVLSQNIADDSGGGCFATNDSILTLESDFLLENKANEGDGGGVACMGESDLILKPTGDGIFDGIGTIFPTVINGNVANAGSNLLGTGRGGGVYATDCRVTIGFPGNPMDKLVGAARTVISNNNANSGNPGVLSQGSGGGIFIGHGGFLDGLDFDVTENISVGSGGGISFDNLGNVTELALGDIRRARINDNKAFNPGGGINVGNKCLAGQLPGCGGKITVEDSDILGNEAEIDALTDLPCGGGGINIGKGLLPGLITDAQFQNVCVAQNIAFGDPLSANGGGICVTDGADVLVNHATIADNSADGQGGGVFVAIIPSNITLLNSIIRFNDAPTLVQPINLLGLEGRDIWCGVLGANLNLENCIVGPTINFNNTNVFIPPSDLFIGQGCIFQTNVNNKFGADPLFVNPGARNYHLRTPFSPAVDMATNAGTDRDKEMTLHECAFIGCNQQFAADIGALEFKEFPCTDNCKLPECALTPECINQGCQDTADAQGKVDCNNDLCFNSLDCQEGVAFNNCADLINNNPQINALTDCADPNCSGAAACQPPTPTPTATPTPTPTPTATPTPTPPTPTPTPTPTPPTPTPTPTPPECQDDIDCPLGEICESNVCIIGCRDNSDCPAGQTCQDFNDFDRGICLSSNEGGNGCSIAAAAPVQLGTAMANILIPLLPALAIGLRVIRRRNKGQK